MRLSQRKFAAFGSALIRAQNNEECCKKGGGAEITTLTNKGPVDVWHKYELEGHIDCGYMAICPEQTAPLHDQEASLAISHQRSTQDIQKYQIKDPAIRVVL